MNRFIVLTPDEDFHFNLSAEERLHSDLIVQNMGNGTFQVLKSRRRPPGQIIVELELEDEIWWLLTNEPRTPASKSEYKRLKAQGYKNLREPE